MENRIDPKFGDPQPSTGQPRAGTGYEPRYEGGATASPPAQDATEDVQQAGAQAKEKQTREKGAEVLERVKEAGREQLERAKQGGKQQAEQRKNQAAEKAEGVAGAVERAADALSEQGQDTLAQYASDLSSRMSSLADRMRRTNIDDLMAQSRELARRHPALFVLGSIGVGVALARFLKASPATAEGSQSAQAGDNLEYPTDQKYEPNDGGQLV